MAVGNPAAGTTSPWASSDCGRRRLDRVSAPHEEKNQNVDKDRALTLECASRELASGTRGNFAARVELHRRAVAGRARIARRREPPSSRRIAHESNWPRSLRDRRATTRVPSRNSAPRLRRTPVYLPTRRTYRMAGEQASVRTRAAAGSTSAATRAEGLRLLRSRLVCHCVKNFWALTTRATQEARHGTEIGTRRREGA
jgi:hypothetical protein